MAQLATITALVLAVVLVLLFRLLLLFLLPLALGLTLVRLLATNLAHFHRLRDILPRVLRKEHSRRQHEPLDTGCGLGDAGSVAVIPGPS